MKKKLRIFNKILRDTIIEEEGANKFCDTGSFYQYWAASEAKPFENNLYIISRELSTPKSYSPFEDSPEYHESFAK